MSAASDKEIHKFIKKANSLVGYNEVKKVLTQEAKPILNDARNNVKDYGEIVVRNKNGKKIASYFPGNLRRSLRVLTHLSKRNKVKQYIFGIWIGAKLAKRNKGTGDFKGNRVDGYYAHMVENGTENQRAQHYWLKAVNGNKAQVKQKIARRMIHIIRQNAKKKGIS